jgi:hypothetical protein
VKKIQRVIPGIYRHYKGPHYLVLGVARNANTEERGVVYLPLEPHSGQVPMLTYRPVAGEDGFFTPVAKGRAMRERFTLLYPVNATTLRRPRVLKRKQK